jgi:hypothetical protein
LGKSLTRRRGGKKEGGREEEIFAAWRGLLEKGLSRALHSYKKQQNTQYFAGLVGTKSCVAIFGSVATRAHWAHTNRLPNKSNIDYPSQIIYEIHQRYLNTRSYLPDCSYKYPAHGIRHIAKYMLHPHPYM